MALRPSRSRRVRRRDRRRARSRRVQPGAGRGDDVVDVLVRRLDPDVPIPTVAHPGDAGADLVTTVDVELGAGERATVPTGLAIALPAGYAAFVLPRSGLAARHGVGIVNAPGTVDAGYRGEIMVTLVNHDADQPVTAAPRRPDRPARRAAGRAGACSTRSTRCPGSARGEGGHGSTGGFAGSTYGGAGHRSTDDRRRTAERGRPHVFRRRRGWTGRRRREPPTSHRRRRRRSTTRRRATTTRPRRRTARTGRSTSARSISTTRSSRRAASTSARCWSAAGPACRLRIEVDQQTQRVRAVTFVRGRSGVQLQAFAAPRSSGIWADVSREIAADATKRGGTATEIDGPYGPELKVVVPATMPDGKAAHPDDPGGRRRRSALAAAGDVLRAGGRPGQGRRARRRAPRHGRGPRRRARWRRATRCRSACRRRPTATTATTSVDGDDRRARGRLIMAERAGRAGR